MWIITTVLATSAGAIAVADAPQEALVRPGAVEVEVVVPFAEPMPASARDANSNAHSADPECWKCADVEGEHLFLAPEHIDYDELDLGGVYEGEEPAQGNFMHTPGVPALGECFQPHTSCVPDQQSVAFYESLTLDYAAGDRLEILRTSLGAGALGVVLDTDRQAALSIDCQGRVVGVMLLDEGQVALLQETLNADQQDR